MSASDAPAPPSSRHSTEQRQAEIVAAALLLARDSSPALITTSDIAAAIGVTQGAVFKHFATKEAISACRRSVEHRGEGDIGRSAVDSGLLEEGIGLLVSN